MAFGSNSYKRDKIHFKVRFSFFSSLSFPFLLLLLFLVVLPFLFIIFYSFASIEDSKIFLTVQNFVYFLSDPDFLIALGLSLWYALVCTLFCVVLAYPVSYFMSKSSPRVRNLINMLITLPMWTNLLLRVVAWKQLLDEGGLVANFLNFLGFGQVRILGTDFAIILVMIYVYLPFMIMPMYTQLLKVNNNLLEASKDLGASKFKTFWKVTFPLSIPGVLSGFTLVFLPAATSLVIPKYMGDGLPKYLFIGELIERYFISANNRYYGSAIAVIMTIVILLLTFIVNKLDHTVVKDQKVKKIRTKAILVSSEEERADYEKRAD